MLPDPSHSSEKGTEAARVTADSVVRIVASKFLSDLLVLFLHGAVSVVPAPVPQRLKRSPESALRRLPLDHPYALQGSSPKVGKSQKVEGPRGDVLPSPGHRVVVLGRFKPHQARLLRVNRQAVLAHPLGQNLRESAGRRLLGPPRSQNRPHSESEKHVLVCGGVGTKDL